MERASGPHDPTAMPRPVWLITGARGFLGRPLLAALSGWRPGEIDVRCLGRRRPPRCAPEASSEADLPAPRGLSRAIGEVRPAVVLHLAGKTPPAPPIELYDANTVATLLLLRALRAAGAPARVVLAGSAAELGPV